MRVRVFVRSVGLHLLLTITTFVSLDFSSAIPFFGEKTTITCHDPTTYYGQFFTTESGTSHCMYWWPLQVLCPRFNSDRDHLKRGKKVTDMCHREENKRKPIYTLIVAYRSPVPKPWHHFLTRKLTVVHAAIFLECLPDGILVADQRCSENVDEREEDLIFNKRTIPFACDDASSYCANDFYYVKLDA